MSDAIYRLDIRYPATRGGVGTKFRIIITSDKGHEGIETVASCSSQTKPKMVQLRAWLAAKGFEAYGDMITIGGTTVRSMVKKIS